MCKEFCPKVNVVFERNVNRLNSETVKLNRYEYKEPSNSVIKCHEKWPDASRGEG